MSLIVQVQSIPQLELDRLDQLVIMQSIAKTRQDNDVTNCAGSIDHESRLNNDMTDGKVVVYDEIIIEMS